MKRLDRYQDGPKRSPAVTQTYDSSTGFLKQKVNGNVDELINQTSKLCF